jgi:hypothetical protein
VGVPARLLHVLPVKLVVAVAALGQQAVRHAGDVQRGQRRDGGDEAGQLAANPPVLHVLAVLPPPELVHGLGPPAILRVLQQVLQTLRRSGAIRQRLHVERRHAAGRGQRGGQRAHLLVAQGVQRVEGDRHPRDSPERARAPGGRRRDDVLRSALLHLRGSGGGRVS